MSYILDALNKSEQERERRQSPKLTTVHHKPAAQHRPVWRWLAALGFLALLNTGLAWYWMSGEGGESRVVDQPATAESATKTPPATQPRTDEQASRLQADQQVANATAPSRPARETGQTPTPARMEGELITPDTVYEPRPQPKKTDPVRIAELPANVQRQIPDLTFSSHIYSDDPSLRMVNINGRNIRVGDTLGDDLTLVEITEDGVVLSYLHYTFEMSVIRDWSFD